MLASDRLVQEAMADMRAALAAEPVDMVLRGGRLVNVWSDEIYAADVAIRRDRIVAIRERFEGEARETVDCSGKLVLPGFVEPLAASASGLSGGALARLLLAQGITSIVVPEGLAGDAMPPLRIWREATDPGRGAGVGGYAKPLRRLRECTTFREAAEAVSQGDSALLDPGSDPEAGASLLAGLAADAAGIDRAMMVRQCGAYDDAPFSVRPIMAGARAHGVSPVKIAQLASFNVATHYGLEHQVGSVAPGRRADIAVFDDLTGSCPALVIAAGVVAARSGAPDRTWEGSLSMG